METSIQTTILERLRELSIFSILKIIFIIVITLELLTFLIKILFKVRDKLITKRQEHSKVVEKKLK